MTFGEQIDREQTEMAATIIDDPFQLKYFAARRVWPMRNEPCEIDKKKHWSTWFYEKFGENLALYANRAEQEGHAELIRAYHQTQAEERGVKCPCSLCNER